MTMFKKYQLTDKYWLELCARDDKDSLNGESFIAEKDWAIEESMESTYGTSYSYYTLASKRFNIPLKSDNPKGAIQQILSYAYTGKETKLKNMWFKIIK